MKHTHVLLFPLLVAASLNCMEKEEWSIISTFKQPSQVSVVSFNRDATILATASDKLYLFNINENKEILSFDIKEGANAISIHNDLLATGASDGIARVRNIHNPEKIDCFQNKNVITATKFHNGGNLLAVAANHTARVFDLRAHKKIVSIQHQDQPVSVCFNKNSQVITASPNKVRVFDIRKIDNKIRAIKIGSVNRINRFMMSVLTNADNGIVTLETPFITIVNENNWIPTKREPGDTLQIYNDITKKTIDTGIGATVDSSGYPFDRFFERKALLFSVDLHPENALLAFGINDPTDNKLRGRALVFAPKNQ